MQQTQYYQEAAKLFEGMTEIKEKQKQNNCVLNNAHLIEEWFKLFLQIVEDEHMLKELHKSLKASLPEDEEEGELPILLGYFY